MKDHVIKKDYLLEDKELEETATYYNHAPYFLSNNSHKGTLPVDMSFMDFVAESSVLSAVLPAQK